MDAKIFTIFIAAVVIFGGLVAFTDYFPTQPIKPGKIDDWQYEPESENLLKKVGGVLKGLGSGVAPTGAKMEASGLGFATGGAKDINNFRDNIENDYLPIPTDIPYEGLFYDYYFDTGQKKECKELFCPSYSRAITKDPLSDETEYYLTVGLNSNLKKEDFERKKLNIVLVLDVSGSMSSGFNQYYYDRFGNRQEVENITGKSKITAAAESLAALTEHLKKGDRLGIVLFNNNAKKAKPLNLVEKTDMDAIRNHILDLQAGGGTNMEAGMNLATEMLQGYKDIDKSEYENRIVFLTDMMPNIGTRSKSGLLGKMKDNAEDGIYTTFVGIGVDFNTELVDAISKVEGSNSFSIHSSNEFSQRMDKDFKYMVTPLVFNLTLELDSENYKIKKVYGSTAAEEATGRIMKVNTLFPSRKKGGKTKGGVVLLKLEKISTGSKLDLTVNYETRKGEMESSSREVEFKDKEPEYFENSGVRKAVLLTRYADLMKNWIIYERSQLPGEEVPQNATKVAEAEGIEPPIIFPSLGKWERQSVDLRVSDKYKDKIQEFKSYFEKGKEELGDENLKQELKILNKLSKYD